MALALHRITMPTIVHPPSLSPLPEILLGTPAGVHPPSRLRRRLRERLGGEIPAEKMDGLAIASSLILTATIVGFVFAGPLLALGISVLGSVLLAVLLLW